MSYKLRKGQAALEFLTTYGWAFLVILVMIGALSYFGVLDPTKFLPQRCQFGAELHCDKFTLDSNGAGADFARFELRNALPTAVNISSAGWKTPDTDTYTPCNSFSSVSINKESSGVVFCDMGAAALTSGEKERYQFKLTYSEGSSFDANFAKDLYGEIYANVR